MKKLLIITCSLMLIAGCSIHKLDIQQGNIVTPEMLDSVKIGMDKERVRFILGNPPITDPFHQDRWDYVYTMKRDDMELEKSHVILRFDAEGRLQAIDRSAYVEPRIGRQQVDTP